MECGGCVRTEGREYREKVEEIAVRNWKYCNFSIIGGLGKDLTNPKRPAVCMLVNEQTTTESWNLGLKKRQQQRPVVKDKYQRN